MSYRAGDDIITHTQKHALQRGLYGDNLIDSHEASLEESF